MLHDRTGIDGNHILFFFFFFKPIQSCQISICLKRTSKEGCIFNVLDPTCLIALLWTSTALKFCLRGSFVHISTYELANRRNVLLF